MPTLRDQLLPVVDSLRQLPKIFGLRRFAVTVRRRVWTGLQTGEGTATDYDIALIPPPKVRDITARDLTATEVEYKGFNNGTVVGAMYRVEKITPQYTGTLSGGYTAEVIRLWPNRDTGAVDNLVSLVGDDGYLRECVQVTCEQDRAFGYSMVVKEIDRPRSALQSIAVTPNPITIVRKRGTTQQLIATGAFNSGVTSILTTLCAWSSSNTAVATVDIYGFVRAVGAGSATITAAALGATATVPITVS